MLLLVEDHNKAILFDTSYRETTLKEFISKTKSESGLEEQIPNKMHMSRDRISIGWCTKWERSTQNLVWTELQCLPGWQGYALWKWGREERQGDRGSGKPCLLRSLGLWLCVRHQREPRRNAGSSLTLQVVSPGQGGSTWAGQGGEGLSGAAHAVPAL